MSDIPNIGTPRAAVKELANMATQANKEGQALANILYDLCQDANIVAATMNQEPQRKNLLWAIDKAKDAARKALNA